MLIHPQTLATIEALKKRKPHAVIISGEAGSGKSHLADDLISALLETNKLTHNPSILRIDASSKGIDAVRSAKEFLSKKTTGKSEIRRCVVIESADELVESAQNALLKTIEEPPADTVIVLLANDHTNLLKTIISRAQSVKVQPVDEAAALDYASKQGISKEQGRAMFFMSGGLPGLFSALIEDSNHPLRDGLNQAKQIVSETQYERLLRVNELSKNREQANLLIESLGRLLSAGFLAATDAGDELRAKKFHTGRKAAAKAQQYLHAKSNTKLVLTELFLSF